MLVTPLPKALSGDEPSDAIGAMLPVTLGEAMGGMLPVTPLAVTGGMGPVRPVVWARKPVGRRRARTRLAMRLTGCATACVTTSE